MTMSKSKIEQHILALGGAIESVKDELRASVAARDATRESRAMRALARILDILEETFTGDGAAVLQKHMRQKSCCPSCGCCSTSAGKVCGRRSCA
jgi:hypothetical protein